MSETENIIGDMIGRLLADKVDAALLNAAEAGDFPAELWASLVENGLPAMLAEGEMGWREALLVVTAAGRHALPLPLPEAIAAGWLLHRAGIAWPDGMVGLGNGDLNLRQGRLSGCFKRVPWGRRLDHVVTIVDAQVVVLPVAGLSWHEGTNLVGEPRDDLDICDLPVHSGGATGGMTAALLGAMVRAGQMAGAITATLDQALAYAGERQQFGRPIGNFQAVQHMLAVLAEESAAATMAANLAFDAADRGGDLGFAVAVAKIRTGEAAGVAPSIAHQVFGAMGFAHETQLHHLTRRLWAWRAEFGAEAEWAARLATQVVPHGKGLWPFLTAVQA